MYRCFLLLLLLYLCRPSMREGLFVFSSSCLLTTEQNKNIFQGEPAIAWSPLLRLFPLFLLFFLCCACICRFVSPTYYRDPRRCWESFGGPRCVPCVYRFKHNRALMHILFYLHRLLEKFVHTFSSSWKEKTFAAIFVLIFTFCVKERRRKKTIASWAFWVWVEFHIFWRPL